MRIIPLTRSLQVYSCRSYLILGDWNHIHDVNTLIDPGLDDSVLELIEQVNTGVGKVPVAQVLLTHNHFDHAGGVAAVKRRYGSRVLAFADGPDVDERLRDGQTVRAGDGHLEVYHTPGHSSDSVCLYARKEQVVFVGDMQLRVQGGAAAGDGDYQASLRRLAGLPISGIFSGHDEPVLAGGSELVSRALGYSDSQQYQ